MATQRELNDPEYRWLHKDEMDKIMPNYSERQRLGIKVIDYSKLRAEYLSTIKEDKTHSLDWNRFRLLIDKVPANRDMSIKKKTLQPKDMYHFERRDRCVCYLCDRTSKYTHFHHIIPNGEISDENIVTLCESCHKMVHIALFTDGKTKGYV